MNEGMRARVCVCVPEHVCVRLEMEPRTLYTTDKHSAAHFLNYKRDTNQLYTSMPQRAPAAFASECMYLFCTIVPWVLNRLGKDYPPELQLQFLCLCLCVIKAKVAGSLPVWSVLSLKLHVRRVPGLKY